jgi:hypothetical protein
MTQAREIDESARDMYARVLRRMPDRRRLCDCPGVEILYIN